MHHTAFRPQVAIVQGGRAQEDAYDWVKYLNDLLERDPEFMSELVSHRPRCNYKVATHPTAQVMNLNQLDAILADLPAAEAASISYDNRTRYEDSERVGSALIRDVVSSPSQDSEGQPVVPQFTSAVNKCIEAMPGPRWACGMLGIINGFLGIAEGGVGPISCEVDTTTGRIARFFVAEPYERRAPE